MDPGSTKFPDACLQAYEDAGIRVIMGDCVTDQRGARSPAPLRHRRGGRRARRRSSRSGTGGSTDGIRAWAMPFSPETCSADLLRRLKRVADERHTSLTLHHDSGPQARKDSQARTPPHPTEYLESIGVLGPNVVLAHSLGVDDAEIDVPGADRARTVAMCPVTAAKGGRGVGGTRADAGAARQAA